MSEKVWTPAEIRRRYESGERDFRQVDLDDASDPASFKDAVLDGADFSGSFVVADFQRASLRQCRFVGANVKTCVFDRADLTGADFSGAPIDAASFRAALLESASFAGATVQGRTLKVGEVPDWD